eukprot:4948950-Alexandrium_andersonii.AAC.1
MEDSKLFQASIVASHRGHVRAEQKDPPLPKGKARAKRQPKAKAKSRAAAPGDNETLNPTTLSGRKTVFYDDVLNAVWSTLQNVDRSALEESDKKLIARVTAWCLEFGMLGKVAFPDLKAFADKGIMQKYLDTDFSMAEDLKKTSA